MKKLLTILCLVLLVPFSTEVSFSQSNQEECDLLCQMGQSNQTETQTKDSRGNKIDGEWSSLDEGLDFIISDYELIVLQDSESLDKCVIEDQVFAKVVCESGAEMYMELKGDKIILSSRNIGFSVSGRGYLHGFGPIMITVLTKKE